MNKKTYKQKDKNRNSKGQFLRGKVPNPKGRPKGAKGKISKNIKDNFEAVFEKLGGIEGFYTWADKNSHTKGAFYQMYSKMLPSNMDVKHSGQMEHAIFMMPRPGKKEKNAD